MADELLKLFALDRLFTTNNTKGHSGSTAWYQSNIAVKGFARYSAVTIG